MLCGVCKFINQPTDNLKFLYLGLPPISVGLVL